MDNIVLFEAVEMTSRWERLLYNHEVHSSDVSVRGQARFHAHKTNR